MRIGLRLQLLFVLGVLLALAFLPLFIASSASTRFGLEQQEVRSARRLAAAAASHVAEIAPRLLPEELGESLGHQVESGLTQAVFALDDRGKVLAAAGEPALLRKLGQANFGASALAGERSFDGRLYAVVAAPTNRGKVLAFSRIHHDTQGPSELSRLMALYMFTSALCVLAFAYFSLTRVVVRPILELEQSARRVAEGSRSLVVHPQGAPELVRLAHSLQTMTQTLLLEEERLKKKIDELTLAKARLAEAQNSLVRSERLATVGSLSAGLAHEIGNPLSALVGFVDLLAQGGLTPDEERDFFERMRREISRIHRVLHDLLTYARAQSPKEAATADPGSYEQAVRSVVSLLEPQKDFMRLELETRLEESLPASPLSTERLTQVLLNLVINAAHAIDGKGRILVEAKRSETGVLLTVDDDGPGIPPELADSLFEPFVTSKEAGKGTGLGLSVARDLVEAAQGSIMAEKSTLGGARFVLRFGLHDSP